MPVVLLVNGAHQRKLKTLVLASLKIARPLDMNEREKKDEIKTTIV